MAGINNTSLSIPSTLYRGNKNNNIADVKTLQYALHVLGYIPENGIDGIFGAKAEVAIKDIQNKYNEVNKAKITVDGKVTDSMWMVINKAVNSVPKLGSTVPGVLKLSKYLVWAGLLPEQQTELNIVMANAIKKFQSKHGLVQSGTLNPKTVTKLVQVRQSQLKVIETQIVFKEMANGEFNHETKPAFVTTGLLVGAGIWIIWLLNKQKKKVVRALA